jgi:HK97 family phage prohead protease
MVQPVPGSDDTFAFRFDFVPERKAVDDPVVVELDDGDLLIEGYAAVFEGIDREGENFDPGAFDRGIKAFLDGQSALCYHHQFSKCLGKVLDLGVEEGKGLRMKARVDGAIRTHPELGTYYQQIKKGTLNALSVGGFFKRALTDAGKRIVNMDFTEISVTPVPVHPGTSFAVVAGKALASDVKVPDRLTADLPETEIRESDFEELQWAMQSLERIFQQLGKRSTPDPAPAAA